MKKGKNEEGASKSQAQSVDRKHAGKKGTSDGEGRTSAPQHGVEAASDKVSDSSESSGESSDRDKDTLESLRASGKAKEDKYIRLLAEFDNFKRRTRRENELLVASANEGLMLRLVEVRENLERALNAGSEGSDLTAFHDGVKLIYTRFDEILGSHGMSPFGEVGDEFDPALHDALMKTPHEEVPEDHLSQVLERGYRLNGRVIKHARVIVSAGSGGAEGKPTEEGNEVSDNKVELGTD